MWLACAWAGRMSMKAVRWTDGQASLRLLVVHSCSSLDGRLNSCWCVAGGCTVLLHFVIGGWSNFTAAVYMVLLYALWRFAVFDRWLTFYH